MRRRTLAWWPAGVLLALAMLAAGRPVLAQPPSDDAVNEVARDLFCPTCQNTPLDVCPTQTCADWRAEIRTQLAEGRNKEQILADFAARYGDHVLNEPPRRGFDLLAWLLPVFAVALGGLVFARYLRAIRAPGASGSAGAPAPESVANDTDPFQARIEQELAERNR